MWEDCRRKIKNTHGHTKGLFVGWAGQSTREGRKRKTRKATHRGWNAMRHKRRSGRRGFVSLRTELSFILGTRVKDGIGLFRFTGLAVESKLEKWGLFLFPLCAPTTGFHSSPGCHEGPAFVRDALTKLLSIYTADLRD